MGSIQARRAIAAAAAFAVAVVAGPAPSGAAGPPVTVAPTTVTFGSTLVVTGSGCIDPDTGDGSQMVVAATADGLAIANPIDPTGSILGIWPVRADGTWTITYQVPTPSPRFDRPEDFDTQLQTGCGRSSTQWLFLYDPVPIQFEWTEWTPPTTTTTTTTTEATTSSTTAPPTEASTSTSTSTSAPSASDGAPARVDAAGAAPTAPTAPPATAVAATATYTG